MSKLVPVDPLVRAERAVLKARKAHAEAKLRADRARYWDEPGRYDAIAVTKFEREVLAEIAGDNYRWNHDKKQGMWTGVPLVDAE